MDRSAPFRRAVTRRRSRVSPEATRLRSGSAMTIHTLPASSGTKALGEREEASNFLTLAVENMRCGGCFRSVERAAMSVAGVRSARANLAAKRVSVAVEKGRASEAEVIAALSREIGRASCRERV